jgi:hypothetical protein
MGILSASNGRAVLTRAAPACSLGFFAIAAAAADLPEYTARFKQPRRGQDRLPLFLQILAKSGNLSKINRLMTGQCASPS